MISKKIILFYLVTVFAGPLKLAAMYSDSSEHLKSAVGSDDLEQIEAAIQLGANINGEKDPQKPTPVIVAINNKRINALEFLLKHGANPRKKAKITYDDDHSEVLCPLLHINFNAPEAKEMAETLIAYGANVNDRNKKGNTILEYAAWFNNVSIIRYLTQIPTVNINRKNVSGERPLFKAISGYGKIETVQALVEHGADVNAADSKGLTVLMYAAQITKDKNNRYDSHHETAFDIAKYLLQTHKINIDQKDKKGRTALVHALENYNNEMAELLLTSGANKTISTNEDTTILGNFTCRKVPVTIIAKLADNGINFNVADESGQVLLMHLAKSTHEAIFATTKHTSEDSENCYRSSQNALVIAEYLLESGKVTVNQQDKLGRTALMYAAIAGNKDMISLLLKFGADIALVDRYRKTAGQYAIERTSLKNFKN